jgi:hypothetical protein
MASVRQRRRVAAGGVQKATWVVDYFDSRKQRHIKTFHREKEALDWLASLPTRLLLPPSLGDGILSLQEIQQLPTVAQTGVYFLLLGKKVQYIGQSEVVGARVERHRMQRRIPFDSWHFLRMATADLDAAEAVYIRAYNPPYNFGRRVRKGTKKAPSNATGL